MIQARGRIREEKQTMDFGTGYSGGFLEGLKALIGKANLWTKPY